MCAARAANLRHGQRPETSNDVSPIKISQAAKAANLRNGQCRASSNDEGATRAQAAKAANLKREDTLRQNATDSSNDGSVTRAQAAKMMNVGTGRRAMAAGRIANLEQGGDRGNQHTGGKTPNDGLPVSVSQAAKLMNVGTASVDRASRAIREGAPCSGRCRRNATAGSWMERVEQSGDRRTVCGEP